MVPPSPTAHTSVALVPHTPFNVCPVALVIAALAWRPDGLFARAQVNKV